MVLAAAPSLLPGPADPAPPGPTSARRAGPSMVLAAARSILRGHANLAALGATSARRVLRVQHRRAAAEARGGSRSDGQVSVQAGRRTDHRNRGHALRGHRTLAGADHGLRQLAGWVSDRMQLLAHV